MEQLLEYLNAEHGRRTRLAAELGITSGAISQWQRVPAERVLEVERITGIPREQLRSDIFGSADRPNPISAHR